jgi:hypothetical protein
MPIDYALLPFVLIVAVDASLKGWGAVTMQIYNSKSHPARYESGIWTEAK